ncbi:MAG: DJ-1/PfpI family protein [Eubacterium sp.]|nr:DJ-1/PfpI family protein [Eubacterium sp.]MDD7210326.1 DJ-1/PfpI family protein [Lachnospiraceae bacterium]
MRCVYLFCADGFEEVEGLTAVDLLRRAGADVKMVSIMGRKKVTSSHGISVETDLLIEELKDEADMLVLPGGLPGTDYLREHAGLADLLTKQYAEGRWVAAICAAPSVLGGLGFLKGRNATSYPGCLDKVEVGCYKEEPVVVDGNVITSRGVGTAIPFALKLTEVLFGRQKAEEIAASIVFAREESYGAGQ